MSCNHSFLLITDDEDKLSDFVAACSDETEIHHCKFLDHSSSLYGLSGECSVLPKELLLAVMRRAKVLRDPSTHLFYIISNQTYVCKLSENEIDLAITIYNHARNIAYTNEGEELPSEAKELIYEWLQK